ncbi:MAG: SAM-dependent methyltransferase [Micavibrio sp.]
MQIFLDEIAKSLKDESFIRLTLAGYRGGEADLAKIIVRRVVIKRQDRMSFTYRYKTRDIVKNHATDAALLEISACLESGFTAATLFTADADIIYEARKGGKPALHRKAPTLKPDAAGASHDRDKKRAIPADRAAAYLHALGLSDEEGRVFKKAQDKYRQINRYIELLAPALRALPDGPVRAADMGSGKGYLTFALYDYLQNHLGRAAHVTGVEMRRDMADLCNGVARRAGFENLHFACDTIEGFDAAGVNVLVALHACDTATDDALYKGIAAGADLIVAAPCCHKQVRRAMEKGAPSSALGPVLRHGIFMERSAEMATDSMRALLLEHKAYKVKVVEFVSDAHTAKNIMIIAEKAPADPRREKVALESFYKIREFYGVSSHHLEKLLGL